jgi:PEP-CTERM motif
MFTAAGTSTTISLLGDAGVNYIGLDNVAVQCRNTGGCGTGVPEPGVLGLMSLGLAAVGLVGRRRPRAAVIR